MWGSNETGVELDGRYLLVYKAFLRGSRVRRGRRLPHDIASAHADEVNTALLPFLAK